MKTVVLLGVLAALLTGCASYRGGSRIVEFSGTEANEPVRGTTGVGSGADPGSAITGSDLVPPVRP